MQRLLVQGANVWHNRAAAVDAPFRKHAVGGSVFMPLLSVFFTASGHIARRFRDSVLGKYDNCSLANYTSSMGS
jgi:hypothetical protein